MSNAFDLRRDQTEIDKAIARANAIDALEKRNAASGFVFVCMVVAIAFIGLVAAAMVFGWVKF